MEYRKLGKHGVKISEVGLGGWLTQGRTLDEGTTNQIVQRAFDLGINFFDTADVYNRGEAELALGIAIREFRREDLVIATKCFFPMSDRPNDRGLGRKHIVESVNASLKRLGTDYIDLMQFHRFDAETPLEETARAIDDLVKAGKVHYWGVSEWKAHQITEIYGIAERCNLNVPAGNQPIYNMLTRGIEESVLPTCERLGIGLVVFSPLAQGVLTGKYLPGQPPAAGTRAADTTSNQFMTGMMTDENLGKVQRLKEFAEGMGYTLAQFSLAWCLRKAAVSSVIIGATSIAQVEANVSASGVKLDDATWEQAEALLA